MSAFSEQFLSEDAGVGGWLRRLTGGAQGPRLFLGAFGKHPGWDDHLDDIGLETMSLVLAKQRLYVEGIGGQLNAGAWDRLPEDQRLPGFGHIFLWRRNGQSIYGRLWASSDRKKRARYPMVVCAQTAIPSLDWGFEQVFPRLEAIEAACCATASAEEVRALLHAEREALREAANAQAEVEAAPPTDEETSPPPLPLTEPDGEMTADPDMQTMEGTLRILHDVRNQWGDYAPGGPGVRDGVSPRELRLSVWPEPPMAALRRWTDLFETLLAPETPLLLLLPLSGDWLDAIVGEPVSESFFSLRANAAALPPADAAPRDLNPGWRQRTLERLAAGPAPREGKRRFAKAFWKDSTDD
jgi:hypothetical protein